MENLSITCYAEPHKRKSQRVLEAFAAGCGANMRSTEARTLEPGACAFYGVREGWKHLWEQAKAEGRDWWYLDNAYFDCARDRYFRATKNAIQHMGLGRTDGTRFDQFGKTIVPMGFFGQGDYVLVCKQSEEFMRVVAGEEPHWNERCVAALYGNSRKVRYREKGARRPLHDDLLWASVLVTWSSAAAVEALLMGVAVKVSAQSCALWAGEDRRRWASVLADNQWTLEEMASGTAWRMLHGTGTFADDSGSATAPASAESEARGCA